MTSVAITLDSSQDISEKICHLQLSAYVDFSFHKAIIVKIYSKFSQKPLSSSLKYSSIKSNDMTISSIFELHQADLHFTGMEIQLRRRSMAVN